MKRVGLRVDVDTLRGTRLGVPELVKIFDEYDITASFFFSVGPDNMGRHLWRLLKPAFLIKMLRTKAASLYGWDILFKGTFWPGPLIGKHCENEIRRASDSGHEIGLHAWDHHQWQKHLGDMSAEQIKSLLRRGVDELTRICGKEPICFAAPAWQLTEQAEMVLEDFSFNYVSTSRGRGIFRPFVGQKQLQHVEIPTNLPTYDEAIGTVCEADQFNDMILNEIEAYDDNVLTIHAEVEGIVCSRMFRKFLSEAKSRNIEFVPLGSLLNDRIEPEAGARICGTLPGREGWITLKRN
jgi:undecaprenyl phosphate-alpha-L-ara4FN deformylase